MGLRTSVTGWAALVGLVSAASGCAGKVPGQAIAMADMRAASPGLMRQLTALGEKRSAPPAALPVAVVPPAVVPPLTPSATAPAVAPRPSGQVEQPPVAPPVSVERADRPALPAKDPASQAAPAPSAVEPAPPKPAAPIAAAEAPAPAAPALAAPEVGFTIPTAPAIAAEADPLRVLFHDTFAHGLSDWLSRGLGQPEPGAGPPESAAEDAVVLATTRARRSLWIKTRDEIDLAGAQEPRLRLEFKGAPVPLRAVWETENGDVTEEVLLSPIDAAEAAADAEFDLGALPKRRGHLVLVARAPKGEAAAPVLDAVTIYDAVDGAASHSSR